MRSAIAIGALLAAGMAAPVWAEDAETARLRELAAKEKQQEQADLPTRVSALEKKLQNSTSSDLRVFWKDGPKMETGDKQLKFEIGGRVYEDFVWIAEDDDIYAKYGNQPDGVEMRTARIALTGELFEAAYFKIEYDFAPGAAAAKDVYFGCKLPDGIGNVQAGHFKEFFDLEELTSSRFITFMERSLCNQAFTPSRNMGFGYMNAILDSRMTYAIGAFKETDDQALSLNEGEWSGTLRLTGLPWYERGGKELVHVGLGASLRSPTNNTLQYRARPEVHIDSRLVDTGVMAGCEQAMLLAPELAAVYGPFSLQAEYFMADVKRTAPNDDVSFGGYYVYGSYFVTGESRNYKTSTGAFDRVRPNANLFGGDGGFGAIELAVRYSYVDLEDQNVLGGKETNITAGVNWHLNPNMRIMLNYINASVKDYSATQTDGKENIFMTRFQFDW